VGPPSPHRTTPSQVRRIALSVTSRRLQIEIIASLGSTVASFVALAISTITFSIFSRWSLSQSLSISRNTLINVSVIVGIGIGISITSFLALQYLRYRNSIHNMALQALHDQHKVLFDDVVRQMDSIMHNTVP
jgi:hypothetical protein